jgi:hypothetical protein
MDVQSHFKRLTGISDQLAELPLFHFFLAGRELFHSNFLYWMFRSRASEICDLFGLSADAGVFVEREKRNIDLTVSQGEKHRLFIENKFKAAVDEEQLERYEHDIEKRQFDEVSNGKVILSPDQFEDIAQTKIVRFVPGHFPEDEDAWYHLSYRVLTDHLCRSSNRYVQDYVEMVRHTLDFMEAINNEERKRNRRYWFDIAERFQQQDQLAEDIKLQDMLQKRRAQRFASDIKLRAADCSDLAGVEVDVKIGFTRKKPLVEALIDIGGTDFVMGIQVQEDQFRRCVLVKRSKQRNSKLTVGDQILNGLQGKWFRRDAGEVFSGGWFEGGKLGKGAKTKNLYQKFGDVFRYQYVKIGVNELDPDDLLDAIVSELVHARNIIKALPPSAASD